MSTIRRSRVSSLWIAVAAVAGAAVAGCGSIGAPSGTVTDGGASGASAFLPFARCMRENGVPNLPDTGQITAGTGIDPASPAFQRAQQKCQKLLPGGGPPAQASEQQKQHLVATSECMRSHGVTRFPDPVTTKPPINPEDYSVAEGIGNFFLLVPRTINVNSPAFVRAAKSCNFH